MPTIDYRNDQLKRLADAGYAAQYLNAAWQETLNDGDVKAFLVALENVVDAAGMAQEKTPKTDPPNQHIHHLLSEDNLTLETMMATLKAVNLTIDFRPLGS